MAARTQRGDDLHKIIAAARHDRERRDFAAKTTRELTVHHTDHNHDHNPPDGSNWELLCLYCHENEHARNEVANAYSESPDADAPASSTYQPFACIPDPRVMDEMERPPVKRAVRRCSPPLRHLFGI